MAERRILDLRKPYPDKVIDELRQDVVAAIDDLADTIVSTDDLYALMDVVLGMAAGSMSDRRGLSDDVAALNTRVDAAQINAHTALANTDALQAAVASLAAQVAALTPPTV